MSEPIQLSNVAAYRTVDENGNGIVIHPRDVQVVLKPDVEAMALPIRPGTARKLGLRPPKPRPTAILTVERPITDEEGAHLKACWEAGLGAPQHVWPL